MAGEETVGQAIRRLRLEAGRGLVSTAMGVLISPQLLSDIEHDRRLPKVDLIQRICAELGVEDCAALVERGRAAVVQRWEASE